jgi:hypothetical protein
MNCKYNPYNYRAMNVLNIEEDLDALGISSNYNGFGSSMKRKGQKKSNR